MCERSFLRSSQRLTTHEFRRQGRVCWWARLNREQYLDVPLIAGNQYLVLPVDLPPGTAVEVGVGVRGHGRIIRETVIVEGLDIGRPAVRLNDLPQPESNPWADDENLILTPVHSDRPAVEVVEVDNPIADNVTA